MTIDKLMLYWKKSLLHRMSSPSEQVVGIQRDGENEQLLRNQVYENNESSENSPVHDIYPRKKRAKFASFFVAAVTSALVLCFTWYSRDEVTYVPDKIANETYYVRQVKTKYHGFFVCALTVFTVLVGAVVDRLTLVAEEIFHVKTRYDDKYCKMLTACFSGLHWKTILFGIIFAVIIITIYFAKIKIEFKLDYLVLVFSGIGFGPLVQRLLKLDTQSEVHISTILEEKGNTVANVLAWSYYIRELKIVLPKIQHAIEKSRWNNCISSSKLVILLPLDFKTDPDNLPKVDQRLSNEGKINCEERPELLVRVLGVKSGGTKKYFLFTFASALQTIFSLSELKKFSALSCDNREEEVASFCQTLERIVNNPAHLECKDKCVAIPYKEMESGSNNWLVNSILKNENKALATGSSALPVGTEHVDQIHVNTPRKTTNINTTITENTNTGEELGRQNEGSSDSTDDDEAHIAPDCTRAKRPSSNTRPRSSTQTIGIDNPSQTSDQDHTPRELSHNNPPQTSDNTHHARLTQLNGKDDEMKNQPQLEMRTTVALQRDNQPSKRGDTCREDEVVHAEATISSHITDEEENREIPTKKLGTVTIQLD